MDISEKIKARRNQLGMTLQEVGDYLGVGKATIKKYETGDIKNLKQGTIEKLSEVLKVSPGYLMGWQDEFGIPTKERIEKEDSFLDQLIKNMVQQGLFDNEDNITESMKKMILEAAKIQAEKIKKDKN